MTDSNGGRLTDESPAMRKARFRGGPLDGETKMVPHHGPAFLRYHERGVLHWYTPISKASKATYRWQGTADRHALEVEHEHAPLLAQLKLIRPGRDGLLELRAIEPKTRVAEREWFTDRVWFAVRVAELRATHDVYVAAAVRARRDGTKAGVDHSWTLWADCDTSESQARLINFEPPPTMIVNSGGGMHAWWRLRNPLPRDRLEAALGQLQRALKADRTAVDAARVLRAVGATNHKYGEPRPVTVGEFDAERVYEVAEILGGPGIAAAASDNGEAPSGEKVLSYAERRAVLEITAAHGEEHPDRHPTLRTWVGLLVTKFPGEPEFVMACAHGLNERRLDPPKAEREVEQLVKWTFEKHWGLLDG